MKRGSTGYSFVVGIDKPEGISSHDVVNRVRRIYGEKRVGHTGTLDPLASGAMAVCVGPATKLSPYLTAHRKAYLARIVFGSATDTDDAEGSIIEQAPVPEGLQDKDAARAVAAKLVGVHEQLPPAYSAIKVGGVKSYEAARKGRSVELSPRTVEVFAAELIAVFCDERGALCWDLMLDVSAGTYVRSIARDLGQALGTCAHLGSLRRLRSGNLSVGECSTLEELEADPARPCLDPVALLGYRFLIAETGRQRASVRNGGKLGLKELELFVLSGKPGADAVPQASARALAPQEMVAALVDNKLAALYAYDSEARCLKACCGFSQGVSRGFI